MEIIIYRGKENGKPEVCLVEHSEPCWATFENIQTCYEYFMQADDRKVGKCTYSFSILGELTIEDKRHFNAEKNK